jgi:uncharacterized protein (TIGR03067 family)
MDEDLNLLQGAWIVTALEMDGQKMPATMLNNARIVIKRDRFTSTGMGAVYEGKVKLETSASPRQIDMEFDVGPENGNTNLGIYKLNRDTLKICLATRGAIRPAKFASPPGAGFAMETLKRDNAPETTKIKTRVSNAKVPASQNSGSATELEGEWQMISGVFDGKPMDESHVQWVKRVTRGRETTVLAGPNVMMKAEFAIDSSRSPKTIDYLNTGGPNKGKIQLGIYKFAGDLLKIYMAAPGDLRPGQFDAAPGAPGTLTVWKRT